MSKVIISSSELKRGCIYDTETGSSRRVNKSQMEYPCPEDVQLRIDVLDGTRYATSYFIDEEKLERIAALESNPPKKLEDRLFYFGIRIANALRGTREEAGPLYNMLASLHYTGDSLVNFLNVNFTIGERIFVCQPHCSNRLISTNEIFSQDKYTADVLEILGHELCVTVDDLQRELYLTGEYSKGDKLHLVANFDGVNVNFNRLYKEGR